MENKKTTELLDLLQTLVDKDGNIQNIEKYEEVLDELKSREPFFTIGTDSNCNPISESIDDIWSEIKKLRRHKHDHKTGDVLIRI